MRKEKILAGLLAALLIISILPTSISATSVLSGDLGTFSVIKNNPTSYKAPIVFSYDNNFIDWFGEVFRSSGNTISTKLAPITSGSGNRLSLIFGGEQENVKSFNDEQQSAISAYFADKAHYTAVDIYLTNLTPNDERAVLYSYPAGNGNGLQDSAQWPSSSSAWNLGNTKGAYVYYTNNLNAAEHSPTYERISSLVGLFGASTRVNIYLTTEMSEYSHEGVKTYKASAIKDDKVISNYFPLSDFNEYGETELDGLVYYLVDNDGYVLNNLAQRWKTGSSLDYQAIDVQGRIIPSILNPTLKKGDYGRYNDLAQLPSSFPLGTAMNIATGFMPLFVTAPASFYTADASEKITSSHDFKTNPYFIYIPATGATNGGGEYKGFLIDEGKPNNLADDRLLYIVFKYDEATQNVTITEAVYLQMPNALSIRINTATGSDVPNPNFQQLYDNPNKVNGSRSALVAGTSNNGADYYKREATTYTISNNYFNDMSLVGISVGNNTTLGLTASAHINDVVVRTGGYLNLTKVNYAILNNLFTRWIDNLKLESKSYIDFPTGTTEAIASAWLGNQLNSEDFYIRVAGKSINPKPNNITVIPRYGVYKPVATVNNFIAYQGTTVYFEVQLTQEAWKNYKGMYAYITGNSSSDTAFVKRELPYVTLSNADPTSPTFNWKNAEPFAKESADKSIVSYYVPLKIGANEDGQSIKVAFDSVLTDKFWGQEHEGVFTFAVKNLPTVSKATVAPDSATVAVNSTISLYTNIYIADGDYLSYKHNSVWTITGNTSSGTKIDKNGVLTVAADETAKTIVVNATTTILDVYSYLFYYTGDGKNFVQVDQVLTASSVITISTGSVVKPPDPDLTKPSIGASHASPTSINVTWSGVAGATGYNLYYSTSATGSYIPVANATKTPSTSAIVSGLSTGTYYWFKVEAVNEKGAGPASDPLQVRARPLRPASINAAPGSKTGQINLSWGKVTECGGYAVYISDSRTGTYVLKAIVPGNGSLSSVISGLRSGVTYYFKVASYVQVGPAKVPSVYTGVVSAKAK